MNEAKGWPVPVCNMRVLPKTDNMEYFPVCSDPSRWVSVSTLPDKPSPISEIRRRAEAIEAAANIAASGMFLLAGMGMLYLVARMGCGVIW